MAKSVAAKVVDKVKSFVGAADKCPKCKRKYRDQPGAKVACVVKHRVGWHCKNCGAFFE